MKWILRFGTWAAIVASCSTARASDYSLAFTESPPRVVTAVLSTTRNSCGGDGILPLEGSKVVVSGNQVSISSQYSFIDPIPPPCQDFIYSISAVLGRLANGSYETEWSFGPPGGVIVVRGTFSVVSAPDPAPSLSPCALFILLILLACVASLQRRFFYSW